MEIKREIRYLEETCAARAMYGVEGDELVTWRMAMNDHRPNSSAQKIQVVGSNQMEQRRLTIEGRE